MKKILSLTLVLLLIMGMMGSAALAVGESNFPKSSAVRNVTMTLSTIDLHDYAGANAGGAYVFRPSVTGRFSFMVQATGEYQAFLFTLNSKNVITGKPKEYKSSGGALTINANLKQSTRYMLVVGKQITLATNGRVQSASAPEGKVQVQVMYDYRGHAFARPYTLSAETTAKERIRTGYQTDFYKFTAPYDAVYTMKTTGGGIWLRVLNSKGQYVTDHNALDMKKGTTCYVMVNRKEKKTGAYTLTAQITEAKQEIPVAKIALNAKKKEISDGKTTTLKAKFTPSYASATAKAIKWTSSDPKIAAVNDEGVVKGMAPGTAKITATTKSGATATCTVKVKAVKVKSVSIKSKLTVIAGETGDLTPTIKPSNATNKNVTWKSSKTSVATVDANGKITALKPGKATITVTTKDGKKKDTCLVTVKAAG